MTGEALRTLRRALELELPWFASLLGMTAAKLDTWERSECVSLHPLQAQTLALLETQVRILGIHAPRFGKQILLGVMVYGPPYGLLIILRKHFEGCDPVFLPARPSEADDPDLDV